MDILWKNTREALKNFAEVLVCNKCGNEPVDAVRYINCGHFFCKKCVRTDTICAKCGTPVQPVEIHSDHMIKSLTSYCNIIAEIVDEKNLWDINADVPNSTLEPSVVLQVNSEVTNRKQPRIPQKNINKINTKGETILHSACLKNKIDYVKLLLAAGANPNTKDNAGWTPLQEVVSSGFVNLCKLLLENGASPNVPGLENRTALHEAVKSKNLAVVKLLLQYSAKRNVYDKHGKKPVDYCESLEDAAWSEIWNILKDGNELNDTSITLNCTLDQSFSFTQLRNAFIVYPSNLGEDNKEQLYEVASKHKMKIISKFRSVVTHVVLEANNKNIVPLSYDVMIAILRGNWLLNSEWFQIAMDVDDILTMDFELFEISGAPVEGTPRRARENAQNQHPRLFNECSFYFALNSKNTYYVNEMLLKKDALEKLVREGNGTILTREPHPEDIEDREQIVLYHIADDPSHSLYKCTHYIIYVPGRDEPRVKYNMPHIKTLPLMWLIECIEKFTLVDPLHLGLL
ncbi:PREDICTED: BRCA1-associated RING domain protein 1-like [Dufourea novaeangliae]|uniref:BRCA1-associated RING domain protein 1 n=1 Tax=Dufourea novaeangliae TaxID=178035 RepID=A0A154PNJ4_DUFNO|nr:PREDICTED: BRCA1-associated RING domain protein 1-like [Dufourea novaeangliae]KZC13413.1 BRCA1-associated RING domain protein 1 [Dufourea novaeangliae]